MAFLCCSPTLDLSLAQPVKFRVKARNSMSMCFLFEAAHSCDHISQLLMMVAGITFCAALSRGGLGVPAGVAASTFKAFVLTGHSAVA